MRFNLKNEASKQTDHRFRRLWYRTVILNALARLATSSPISPIPIMPSVAPVTSTPRKFCRKAVMGSGPMASLTPVIEKENTCIGQFRHRTHHIL